MGPKGQAHRKDTTPAVPGNVPETTSILVPTRCHIALQLANARSFDQVFGVLCAIDDNRIPTMTLHDDQGVLRIEVSRIQPGLVERYVAFSHVWVDGLGSTTEHGIYEVKLGDWQLLPSKQAGLVDRFPMCTRF